MTVTRRAALGGVAAGFGAWAAPSAAITLAIPPIEIRAARLEQGGWLRGVAALTGKLELDGKPVPMDDKGRFFIAFDRDAGPQAALALMFANGGRVESPLTIAPRHWDIQNIDAPFHPPGIPDAEFARIRATEVARIEAARAHDTGATGWRQSFRWPVAAPISGHFGSQRIYRGTPGSYHSGTDLAAGAGTPYHAPADGTVILAAEQPFTLEGHLLMVDHGMGLNSAFLHASQLLVKKGEHVTQGQPLGLVGMTGRATGPHLHWSLRWREARLDPELFVGA